MCVYIRGRWREGGRWRSENPIIFNNKGCYIKGRTSTAFHFCVATEIRSGTMRHIDVHDFYQFNYWNLNSRQWGRGWRKDLRLHTAGAAFFLADWICESDHRCGTESSVRMRHTSQLPKAPKQIHLVWRLKEGHLATADARRPTARFH